MTFLEKLRIERPEMADYPASSIARGCPYHYGYESIKSGDKPCDIHGEYTCDECWNREIPETEPTKNTIHEKGEKEMEPRNISFSPTATMAKEPKNQTIGENMSDLRQTLIKIYCEATELDRYLFGDACSEPPHQEPSCLEEDVLMTKDLATAILGRLCLIKGKL